MRKKVKKRFLSSWLIRSPFTKSLDILFCSFSYFLISSLYCGFQTLTQDSIWGSPWNLYILPKNSGLLDAKHLRIRLISLFPFIHTELTCLQNLNLSSYSYAQILDFLGSFDHISTDVVWRTLLCFEISGFILELMTLSCIQFQSPLTTRRFKFNDVRLKGERSRFVGYGCV